MAKAEATVEELVGMLSAEISAYRKCSAATCGAQFVFAISSIRSTVAIPPEVNEEGDDEELIDDETDSTEDEFQKRYNRMTFVVATRKKIA